MTLSIIAYALECYQCPQFSGYSKCYEGGDDYGEVMTCPPGVYACYNNWSGKYSFFRCSF